MSTTEDARSSGNQKPRGVARLKNPKSLERLRERVQEAVDELTRLREENAALHEHIEALEARPAVDPELTLLTLDEDPAVLRRKIEGFIATIDAYLAEEDNEAESA